MDVVSDGEAQRDNMIDYFTEQMPGVQIDQSSGWHTYWIVRGVLIPIIGISRSPSATEANASNKRILL